MKKRILLTIAYDGTEYAGWQKQKYDTVKTVQGTLECACKKLFGQQYIELIGASRTDAGVHAIGQRAVIDVETSIPAKKIPFAIRSLLPDDIVVRNAEEVSENFHPRYDCVKKTYCYTFYVDEFQNPMFRKYSVFVPQILDILAMKQAAKHLIGTHDFKCFCATGSNVSTTVRTIFDCNIEQKGHFVTITVTGDGFLYNMVRIIAGTLLDVAKGNKRQEDMIAIIKSKDRTKAGMTAPAKGLTLLEIYY